MEDAASGRDGDLLMAKISEVAEWVGVSSPAVDGEITAVSSIEAATVDVRWCLLLILRHLPAALASKAGMILAGKSSKIEGLRGIPGSGGWLIPDMPLPLLLKKLKGKGFEAGIHPSAVVGDGVEIGTGTSIGPGVVIGDGVRIGNDCNILARVTLYPKTVLGRSRGGAGRSGAGVYRIWLCAECGDRGVCGLSAAGKFAC